MRICKKAFILIITYLTAAVIALGAYCYALVWGGAGYKRTAEYGYEHAFYEVVNAVSELADALHRGEYATGEAMSNEVCAEVYGDCLAAGMTMSALPFSTQELEQTARFIGTAGDYAQSLLRSGVQLDGTARENLGKLYKTALKLKKSLDKLRDDVNDGSVIFDEPENRFPVAQGKLLSASLKKLEDDMDAPTELNYDGAYSKLADVSCDDPVSVKKQKKAAAEFFDLDADKLKKLARSESGSTIFTCDNMSIVVDGFGNVVSMSTDRAVAGDMSDSKLKKAAQKFLEANGFSDLVSCGQERYGGVLTLSYNCSDCGVCCEADKVKISVAGDDGSIYAFSVVRGAGERAMPENAVSEAVARLALPENVTVKSSALIYAETLGGRQRLCYRFDCHSGDEKMNILVDAATGKQFRIDFE